MNDLCPSTPTGTGVIHAHDGDGKRVQKPNGKLHWHGMSSDPLDETDLSGNITAEYMFFGGRRIARREASGNVNYYFAGRLGTARALTWDGLYETYDYLPFGEQLNGSSHTSHKFTGKERDSESGRDNSGQPCGL